MSLNVENSALVNVTPVINGFQGKEENFTLQKLYQIHG